MSAAPSLTVLIPTYNRERFLPAALDSILEQDHPHFEVLVVDDGSTDSTPDILARYADRHPEVVRFVRKDNGGQAMAVNLGFEEARSELISLVSDDDVLLPGALAKLAGALAERPEAVVAFGDYLLIDAAGAEVARVGSLEFDLPRILELYVCTIGPGVTLRRAVLAETGGWDTSLRSYVDFDFWLRLALYGPFVRIPDVLSGFRQHPTSISNTERGPHVGAEAVAVLQKFYEHPRVPPAALAVRARAFRNAYYNAAILCEPAVNGPDERFLVADLLSHSVVSDGHAAPEPGILRYEADLRRIGGELERSHDELRELHATAGELHRQVDVLHGEVARRDATIAALHGEVAQRDATIATLHDEVAQRDVTIAALHEEVAGRDVTIATLHGEVAQCDVAIATLHEEVARRDVTIAALHGEVAQRDRRNRELEAERTAS